MKSDNYNKKLTRKLLDLDKKSVGLDEILQDVRIEINNMLWDLIELKKDKGK